MATKRKSTKAAPKKVAAKKTRKAPVVKAEATETPKTLLRASAFDKEARKVTEKDLVEAMALKREIRRIKEGRKSATLTQKQATERLDKTLAKLKVSLEMAKNFARNRGIFEKPAPWEATSQKAA